MNSIDAIRFGEISGQIHTEIGAPNRWRRRRSDFITRPAAHINASKYRLDFYDFHALWPRWNIISAHITVWTVCVCVPPLSNETRRMDNVLIRQMSDAHGVHLFLICYYLML